MKQLVNRYSTYIKRGTSAAMATSLLCALVFSSLAPKVAAATSATAMSTAFTAGAKVSFTFDDGAASAVNLAAPSLAKYGYAGTDYVITNCVGMTTAPNACAANPDIAYMTWDQLTQLQNTYGWEIGSHTKDHPLTAAVDNPSLTDALLDAQMSGSQSALASHGFTATDFASPYGDYDNRSIAAIAKYYNSHRTFQDDEQPAAAELTNTFPYYSPRNSAPYNNYLLTTKQVQGNVPVATVKGYIDQAKANGQWLVLVFHDIKASGASTAQDAYEYNAADLEQIAAYVKAQGLPVTDMAHGLATSSTNLLANGTFNNGIADGWTTDNAATIVADKQSTSLAGHGSYDGTTQGPLNSVALTGAAADAHLFSPTVSVDATQSYIVKSFVNVTSTSGEVDFFVDEYDANGVYLSGKYQAGVVGATTAGNVQVGSVNFNYKPTSATVAKVRVQVIAHGAGLKAYVDNVQLFPQSAIGTTTPPVVVPPATKLGDLDGNGLVNGIDLSTLQANWNPTTPSATKLLGDLDGNGLVNGIDLSTLLANWSK